MDTTEIIDLWSDMQDLAADVGVKAARVHKWRQRGRIPAAFWRRLCSGAARRELPVSLEGLAVAAEREAGLSGN